MGFNMKHTRISSKLRTERIFRYSMIAYFLLWCVVGIILLSDYTSRKMAIIIFSSIPLLVSVFIYFGFYFPIYRSAKYLRQDRNREPPTNEPCVICASPFVVIPYSQIAWVHLDPCYPDDSDAPLYYTLTVHCKDGKKFLIEAGAQAIYQEIIAKVPGVITGNGSAQKKQFYQNNPIAKNRRNRAKCIWGIVLLLIMAGLSVLGILNQHIEPMGFVVLGALLIGGIALLWQGLK